MADAVLRSPTRTLPPIFDRLVVILTVQAHLFGVVVIVQQRASYRSGPGIVAVWVASASIPLICLAVARRTGGVLSTRAFAGAGICLVGVDAASAALVHRVDLGGPAMWMWSVVGVSILTLVPFRPVRDVLGLAAVHGLVTLVLLTVYPGQPRIDYFGVLSALNGGLLPALAATQFVGLYLHAVRSRESAVAEQTAAQARTLSAEAVERDTAGRLARLREQVVPLLQAVAAGELPHGRPEAAVLARRLSDDLRRELLDSRSGAWFLDSPRAQVLDPRRCLERLGDADRASLAVFVQTLSQGRDWDRLSVTLAPLTDTHTLSGPHTLATPVGGMGDDAEIAALTVIALGDPARSAADDLLVAAAAARLGAELVSDSARILTADALMRVQPERNPLGLLR